MTTLIFDIEANGFLPAVDTVWQLSIMTDGVPDVVDSYGPSNIDDGIRRLGGADRLVAHNALTYDFPVLEKVFGVRLDRSRLVDTLVLSRLGKPERRVGHSLEAWGDMLGFPKIKHDEWDKWSPEMAARCDQDVRINYAVWERLKPMLDVMPEAVDIEMKTAAAVFDMCQTGIHFDEEGARRLLDTLMVESQENYDAALRAMEPRFKCKTHKKVLKNINKNHWAYGKLEPGVPFSELTLHQPVPSSRQDIADFLILKYGWKPTQKTPTGLPKVDDDILRGLPWPEAGIFANYLKTEKLISQLNSEVNKAGNGGGWLQHVTKEGKLHANFIPLTAVTGRPSCVAPNLQQVSTDPRARELFRPRPGWKLVGVDADGQELRCLGHYLWPFDGGAYAKEVVGGDIHTRVQKLIGFHTRNGTKPVEYGLIYGAGNAKLGLIAVQDALAAGAEPPKDLPKRGKEIRSAIMSGITGFEDLLSAVRQKAMGGKLKGLDGRTLWVRSPHSALNLLLQSCGIIHMKKAISMLRPVLEEHGFEYQEDWVMVLWVHDEVQLECRPELAEQIGQLAAKVVERAAKDLGIRTPMTGTYQIGNNWKETH